MNVNELVTELRYRVNNSGMKQYLGQLRQGAKNAKEFTAGFVEGARQAIAEHRKLNAAQDKTNRKTKKQADANDDMFSKWRSGLGAVVGLLGSVSAAGMADEWAGIRARVGLEIDKRQVDATLNELFNIAQDAQQAYSAVADVFLPITRNRKELEITNDQALLLAENITKIIATGGGEAGANKAALVQLGQALGSGVLRGDELNSIMEQTPKLAQAIAEALGVSVGKLRELGGEGKITAKAIATGLLKQTEKINDEFAQMPKTFGGATTVVVNAIGRQIDRWNRLTGAAEKFSKVMRVVADNVEHAMNIGLITGVIVLMAKLRTVAWSAALPFLRLAAVVAGVYLVLEDLVGWAQGKDSLIGELLGDPAEWESVLSVIRAGFDWIKSFLGAAGQTTGQFLVKWGAIALAVVGFVKILGVAIPIVTTLLSLFFGVAKIVALIATGIISWPLVIAAAIIAATVAIYQNWETLISKLKEGWTAFAGWLETIVPDWVKSGASWIAGKLGISDGAAASPRASGSNVNAPVTVTNQISVTAPNSDPGAVANATGQAVQDAAYVGYRQPRRGMPRVEAAS